MELSRDDTHYVSQSSTAISKYLLSLLLQSSLSRLYFSPFTSHIQILAPECLRQAGLPALLPGVPALALGETG